MHHACDGTGSTGFPHTWAAAYAGVDELLLCLPPSLVVKSIKDLYDQYTRNLPHTDKIRFIKMPQDQLLSMFT
jgi:hypothetical protein